MEPVIEEFDPDVLVVQGDTTTTLAGALCGFYAGKRVAHIEAGLRTGDKKRPFPEEANRRMTSVIADYHFAPTESAKRNLCDEGYDESRIYVTGNTVIDALIWMVDRVKGKPCPFPDLAMIAERYSRLVLITGHRRESFGTPIRRIFSAFRQLAQKNPAIGFVYPVHMNPNVQDPARDLLAGLSNFFLLPPLPYPVFCWLMDRCEMVITDSGGVQEEAPSLGKPVLVTRKVTERPEAVQQGMAKLVNDDPEAIVYYAQRLIDVWDFYTSMAKGYSPYGDGKASERILDVLLGEKYPGSARAIPFG
jgi:UDP-N-acetylglucosamine 2-epimerase (non-hydrolysing)